VSGEGALPVKAVQACHEAEKPMGQWYRELLMELLMAIVVWLVVLVAANVCICVGMILLPCVLGRERD
jgi:hypothetical protein